jgi:twitching motility protein PilI
MVDDGALAVLKGLEAGAIANRLPLPVLRETEQPWQGMGFQVGGVRLVAALGDIGEVMTVPRVTVVPGVKEWLLGLANVRGRLLPVVDLHRFWAMPPTCPASQWRVLVAEHDDIVAGLLVERSLGMQYFSERSAEAPQVDGLGALARRISRTFRHAGHVFHQVQIKAVLSDEQFLDAATQQRQ